MVWSAAYSSLGPGMKAKIATAVKKAKSNSEGGIRRLDGCWDTAFAPATRETATDETLSAPDRGSRSSAHASPHGDGLRENVVMCKTQASGPGRGTCSDGRIGCHAKEYT